MNDTHSLSHTKWNCKYHIVFAPRYRRKVFFEDKRLEVGQILRELCKWKGVNIIEAEVCPDHVHMVDTAGKDAKKIKEYIQKQLREDELSGQLMIEDANPFTGGKE